MGKHLAHLPIGQNPPLAEHDGAVREACYQGLVLDEPTTGQDHRESLEIMALVRQLNRKGHTIIFITHDQNPAGTGLEKPVKVLGQCSLIRTVFTDHSHHFPSPDGHVQPAEGLGSIWIAVGQVLDLN